MPTFLYPRTIELMVLGPSDSELTAVAPRFSGLWIRAKFFHWVSRFSIMKKETLELLRLHNHVSQFLQFSSYIYMCVCVYNIHIYIYMQACSVISAMSDSLQPHGLQPAKPLCPWNFPGKNTEMGFHFLLQGIFPTQGLNSHLLHFRQILNQ